MSRSKNVFILSAVVLLLSSLACSLGTVASPQSPGQPAQPGKPGASNVNAPVGIRQGLASLDTYTYQMRVINSGPTPEDKNNTLTRVTYDSNGNNSKAYSESVSSSASDPTENRSSSTRYQVGDVTCTVGDGSDSKPSTETTTAAQKEMTNIMGQLMDMTIYVENPVAAGSENVNGIDADHYTFDVKGLGKSSGAEVTQSSGEYWVAKDGRYLVKYAVVLETRSAPEGTEGAEVLHTEIYYELSDVNAAVDISLPAECN
jgi:hypothetical protein